MPKEIMDPPFLTDSVIFLRPLEIADAAAHLAGEDEEIAAYLSGGKSNEKTVQAYIEQCLDNWRHGGSILTFGVFSCATSALVGSVEANLDLPILSPGQANISYSTFSMWRGQGIAVRAVRLVCEYLRRTTNVQKAIVRTVPNNKASTRVAVKAGFSFEGVRYEALDTSMLIYSLCLRDL